jgi:hypothetical protein
VSWWVTQRLMVLRVTQWRWRLQNLPRRCDMCNSKNETRNAWSGRRFIKQPLGEGMGKPILKWSYNEKMQYVRSWLRIVFYGGFCFGFLNLRVRVPHGQGTRVEIKSLDRPWEFQEVEAPRFPDNRHMKLVRSAVCTGRFKPPGNIPGTHFP